MINGGMNNNIYHLRYPNQRTAVAGEVVTAVAGIVEDMEDTATDGDAVSMKCEKWVLDVC